MTPEKALELIEAMARESQRTVKEGLLTELLAEDLGKFIVKWAYDPFITFGIKPVRHASNFTEKVVFDMVGVSDLLNKLAQRELTGNAAADVVSTCLKVSDDVANELLWRILNKDLRCGIAESTIQKIMPGLIPTFAVMRAHPYEEHRVKVFPQYVEPKLDGYRFTFICRNGSGGFFTRTGKRNAAAEHLVEPMIKAAIVAAQTEGVMQTLLLGDRAGSRQNLNFMVDGEMIVDESFKETGALRRKDKTAEGAKFHVFDIMSFEDFDKIGAHKTPYCVRRANVTTFVAHADPQYITKTPAYLVNSHEEIIEYYNKFRARGLEGAMVKDPEGGYDKKKSYGWMKIKAEETEDLPIVGFYNGEKNKEFENTTGGLIVARIDPATGETVEVRVGGGFSKELRDELADLWEEDAKLFGISPNVGFKPGQSFTMEKINEFLGLKLLGRLIEVEYHEVTPDGSLRHPRFVRFRDDKDGEIDKS